MAHPKSHAIMFPYPYQGHVTPMVNLAIRLASEGFTITFVQTEYIHHSISKAQHLPPTDLDLFDQPRKSGLDIRYTTISDGFPPEFDRDLHYDEYWLTMFRDFPARVDDIVVRTIKGQDPSAFVLITDTFYSWPTTIAKKYNLVNVSLWTEPAIVFSVNYHLDLLTHYGHFRSNGNDDIKNPINYIPGIKSISKRDLMSYIQDPDMIPVLTQVVVKGFEQVKAADFILCNTVQELEPETIASLNERHPTYAIGPINFYSDFPKISIPKSLWCESDATKWLNSKPPGSVLYVSFGSIVQSSKEEIAELAHGILLSGVYFVWVLRPDIVADTETGIADVLPTGFKDAVKDKGLIVPWCNQEMVLSSPASGGFLTHCGWNSILESIWHGIPMICHPFLVDQLTNRKLVVDDWNIGINLCDGEQVSREEVARKINILMGGEKSNDMKKVRQKLQDSLGGDGSSRRNFDQFVQDLRAQLNIRSKSGQLN